MAEGELNESANEELDDKQTTANKTNGTAKHQGNVTDPDAQEMVISSLRAQIQDLFSQVSELNNKLVKSYDRVSDLEDDLHVTSSNFRTSSLKISQLELERSQHLSALNTGLLVEKSHVTAELNRLMEKATEEAAQRGQAESARADIEKDLDDLSATLFGQANSMVAEARYAQYLSERKVEEAERALKGAEEAVGVMQQQMQALQAEKEEAENKAHEMQTVLGKGKWIERSDSDGIPQPMHLLSPHVPYQEFLLFVAHLRSVHPSSPTPPAMATLLPLPFLTRLLTEDSDPTVRLDLAPSLNWLSRRSVLSAIHNGQLTIEPVSSSTFLQDSSSYPTSTSIPGLNSNINNVSCALCGTPIFKAPDASYHYARPQSHQISAQPYPSSNSWSTALFKKPSHSTNLSVSQTPQQLSPPQVYIFRLGSSPVISAIPMALQKSTSTPPQHPNSQSYAQSASPSAQSTTTYPLCANGWCLHRLRTTCTLWAFVRTGIVEKIWEEEVPKLAPPSTTPAASGDKPPVPPRRRGLWGMASALGERASSWSDGDKDKTKKTQRIREERRLPPPPTHPTILVANVNGAGPTSPPPPLPKRNQGRGRQRSSTVIRPNTNVNGTEGPNTPRNLSPLAEPTPSQSGVKSPQWPITPANIPLPESRPGTPVVSPSRSPTPVPGSAVPPPLPRRAAARAPRPANPVSAVEDPAASVGGNQEVTAVQDESPAKSAEADKSEPDQPESPKEEEKAASTEVDLESAPNGDVASTDGKLDVVTADAAALVSVPAAAEKDVTKAEDSDGEGSRGEEAIREKEAVEPQNDEKLVNCLEPDKEIESEEDKEVYIGDATWEERTWKEIVRLKEVMFWARMGGGMIH